MGRFQTIKRPTLPYFNSSMRDAMTTDFNSSMNSGTSSLPPVILPGSSVSVCPSSYTPHNFNDIIKKEINSFEPLSSTTTWPNFNLYNNHPPYPSNPYSVSQLMQDNRNTSATCKHGLTFCQTCMIAYNGYSPPCPNVDNSTRV